MVTYGFDGADIDWEYPVACERGGVPEDQENYVKLMKNSCFDLDCYVSGLTFTAPTSYWYLQHFDLPGLLESADWINLMTYDLHGIWDAESVFTGKVIGAHTNLTEIDNSLQLFIRVGIDLNKLVLGLGFYGRSFELQDNKCIDPTKGCRFSGPAAGGPCTQASGILSYSEIQDVLTRTNATPVWDKTAAVKYFGFDDGVNLNQWEAGVMIWAVDQDDFAGDALTGVLGKQRTNIPKPTGIGSNDGQSCVTMDCGASCPAGFVQVMLLLAHGLHTGDLADPTSGCQSGKGRSVCCPANNVPQKCLWRGCDGVCNIGEIALAGDPCMCSSGHKEFCCESGLTADQIDAATDCQWYVYGSLDQNCIDYSYGCAAHGFSVTCCPIKEIQLCCKPPGGSIATAPFTLDEIFDDPPQDEDLTWDVQEEDIDEHDPKASSGDENDTPFGLVAGPDGFVSDMTFKSNWVVTGCKDTEDQQTATAFCSRGDTDETCNHVFIRSAADTIVKMPATCGPGPYARVVSLTPKVGKRMMRTKRGETATVYDFTFDYRFDLIQADDDTEVLMRIDVVTADVRRRDLLDDPELIKRGIEERWLAKATSVAKDTNADLLLAKGFSANLFSFSQNCVSEDATTEFAASLDVTAHGSASVHLKYGFYVQAHILPSPKIDAAYLYIIGNAGAEIGIDVYNGKASVTYTGKRLQLIPEITWPGLSYPDTGGASLSGTFSLLASVSWSPICNSFTLTFECHNILLIGDRGQHTDVRSFSAP
ncbi:hypothetical protein BD779DRAFT_1563538 [Infundibulicybe gibba]|nr:hypothetical protein BD779DRAFT_1563538 [Infundibulicybe gibba]